MLTITFNLSSRYCGEMSNCGEIDLLLFGKICSQERSLCSWGNEGCIKCQCCTISPRTRQGAEQQSGTHVQMQGSKDTHSWCTAELLFSPNLSCCNSSKKATLPLTAIKFKDTNKFRQSSSYSENNSKLLNSTCGKGQKTVLQEESDHSSRYYSFTNQVGSGWAS